MQGEGETARRGRKGTLRVRDEQTRQERVGEKKGGKQGEREEGREVERGTRGRVWEEGLSQGRGGQACHSYPPWQSVAIRRRRARPSSGRPHRRLPSPCPIQPSCPSIEPYLPRGRPFWISQRIEFESCRSPTGFPTLPYRETTTCRIQEG